MTKFFMNEMPDLSGKGQRVVYPKMVRTGIRTLDDAARRITSKSTYTPSDIRGMVSAITEFIGQSIAEGYSVKIDGLGIFTATLGFRPEAKSGEPDKDMRHKAPSVEIRSVKFRADNSLIRQMKQDSRLERTSRNKRKTITSVSTQKERLAMAIRYLEEHAYFTVADYQQFTGMLHTAAVMELQEFCRHPESGIRKDGRGSHVVYVRR